ncbi:phage tail length tape measure family protein [Clostridium estertheticum]|uniref:phage tail length tape measure family protein n=1 Tax=Clostridium estertheticum TaxID=238834 RepID=UPI001CF59B91|nr:phage tail length tape measure family protein [Clostridium estertheticum]MCB2309056.1 phage tail length tape measure family protein [Clostridium estertheticum]MCB2346810.1 phage tail length tape measure family protein [Clostridium estertheticum]MCB2351878.1 phage tail length tape measure family protein [Clostridium estertheticum]WAG48406.1 phage tail length tape measure family protein [Clostridium estertheticum]
MAYQLSAVFNLGGNYIKQMQLAQKETSGMNKSLATVGGGFSKLASLAIKAGAVIGLGLGLKDMVTKASAAQQKLAQMDAVLKSTGGAAGMSKDALLKLADAQSKVTTFSKGTTMAGENLLLTFTGIGKKAFPETIKAAQDMSTALKTDLNSSVMTLGKALNDPATGLAKLTKQGVTFTTAQKEQVKAMVKVGNVGGAQAIMLKELQKEFGGSANAAGKTFAGQLTILKNSMAGVESSLGMVLIPYLTKFATSINTHIPKIKQVLTGMIDFVVPKFKTMIDLIGQIVQTLLPNFGSASNNAKTKASDLAKNGINLVITALTWIKNNMGAVKVAIAGVTTVWAIQKGVLLVNNIVLAVNNGLSAIAAIKSGALTVAIIALYVAQGVGTIATGAASIAMGTFNTVMGLNPIIKVIMLVVALGAAIYGIITHWKAITTWIGNTWKKLMDNPVAKFILMMNPFTAVLVVIYDNFGKISSAISTAWNWLKSWNGTKAENKTATMTTQQMTTNAHLAKKAKGDKNWMGGPVITQEAGGEILDLPSHTRIIPHDVSMKMAETAGKSSNNDGKTFIMNNYFTGNVGNKEFFDEASEQMSKKILTLLGNMG